MKFVELAWKRIHDLLFETSYHHPLQLGSYRILYAGYVLISNQAPDLSWVSGIPDALRNPPPGLPRLLPAPSYAVTLLVEIALALALVGLLFGWKTKTMSIAVGVLGLISSTILFSFGKIDHSIMLWLVPLAMSTSSWGKRFSVDARSGLLADKPTPTCLLYTSPSPRDS